MGRIDFDIKYVNEIVSGKYKPILECGVKALILSWNIGGEYPIVCMADKKEKLKEPASEDFESEWKRYCDSKGGGAVTMNIKDVAKHFAQWQKEQMMKDAVEGRLGSTVTGSEQYVSAYAGYGEYGKDGDKVKLIIIKE